MYQKEPTKLEILKVILQNIYFSGGYQTVYIFIHSVEQIVHLIEAYSILNNINRIIYYSLLERIMSIIFLIFDIFTYYMISCHHGNHSF